MDLFKLVGSIFIDNEKANDSLQKTDDKAKKVGTSFKDVAGKAAQVGTAVVAASAAAVSGIVAMASNTASAADEIDKASTRMGISTDSYQELAFAAERSGLFYGNMYPNTDCRSTDKETKELMGYIADYHDSLQATLTDQQKEQLEKFVDCYGELTDINEREIFVYAFRLGARIAIEVLCSDSGR